MWSAGWCVRCDGGATTAAVRWDRRRIFTNPNRDAIHMNPTSSSELISLRDALIERVRSLERVIVAFSGGVDSALVAAASVAALGRHGVLAVTARSPSVPAQALADAERVAKEIGIPHRLLATGEFDDPDYVANAPDRCYHCKTELYTQLAGLARRDGYAAVVNGVNADDLGDYRPGLAAADEHGVRSPLAELGIGKAGVRALALLMNVSIHDKPASPCLSSRVRYGEEVTAEKLAGIDRGESLLRALGFSDCRVRHHGDLARIEVPRAEIERFADAALRERVVRELIDIGYAYVTIDMRGLRSGSMNEVLLGEGLSRLRSS
jgi:uncharacterized protein